MKPKVATKIIQAFFRYSIKHKPSVGALLPKEPIEQKIIKTELGWYLGVTISFIYETCSFKSLKIDLPNNIYIYISIMGPARIDIYSQKALAELEVITSRYT